MKDMLYRRDIDGLRAIAVLSVVGFHAFGVRGGFIGVDIFFVISGFLISTIILTQLQDTNFSFINFYAKRVRRIFPALILVLVVSLIIGWFILLPDEYKQLGKHAAGASIFISNFLLRNEAGYFDNASITKPLLHLWSLGIEEQFYIIWPLLLWISWKKKFNVIYTIIAVALISLTLNIINARLDPIATFYLPQTRFWELLLGSCIAWFTLPNREKEDNNTRYSLSPRINNHVINNVLSFLGILIIIFCLFFLSKDNYFVGPLMLLPTIATVFIILAGSQTWLNRMILSHPILVWFGLISFPLYLWHWPLLVFSKLSISDGIISSRATKILAVATSIILAWITYKFIETPIRFGANFKTKTRVLILLVLMAMIGMVGYAIYFNQGLDFRVPKILQVGNIYQHPPKYPLDHCMVKDDKYHFGACTMVKDITKKTLLLWGDSHAAHFYPGYKERFGKEFNIILLSETGCRPILKNKSEDEKCYAVNSYILDLIKREKPQRVILSAAWGHHDDWGDVAQTIDRLQSLGVNNIDLIGPAPDWIDTLPRQLFIYSHLDKEHRIPVRMSFGLDKHFLKLDVSMKALAKRKKVNYISLAEILCNTEGCMTRVGAKFDRLISLDYGHFTEPGAIYIVSKFPDARL